MLERKEAVEAINKILSDERPDHKYNRFKVFHWGNVEIREILDAIYEGPPKTEEEEF